MFNLSNQDRLQIKSQFKNTFNNFETCVDVDLRNYPSTKPSVF